MKTKAVVHEPGQRIEVEELDLAGPWTGEVNEGYDGLLAGHNVRGVIVHEH